MVRFSDCRVWLQNNAFVGTGLLQNGIGGLSGTSNWFSSSISIPEEYALGHKGVKPMFTRVQGVPFVPGAVSPLLNRGNVSLPLKVQYMPASGGGGYLRPRSVGMDIGAYELSSRFKPVRRSTAAAN